MSFTLVNEKLFTWEKLDHATQILPIAKEIDSWREASEEDFYSLFSLSEMYSTWQLCAKVFYVSVPHRNGLSVDLIQKSYDRKLKHKKLTSVQIVNQTSSDRFLIVLRFSQSVQFCIFWANIYDDFDRDARPFAYGTAVPAYNEDYVFQDAVIRRRGAGKPAVSKPSATTKDFFSIFGTAEKSDRSFSSNKASSVAPCPQVSLKPSVSPVPLAKSSYVLPQTPRGMMPLINPKSFNFAGSSSVLPKTASQARECDDQRILELRNLLEPHSDNALTFTFVFDMLGQWMQKHLDTVAAVAQTPQDDESE